jgi:putative membrane protein
MDFFAMIKRVVHKNSYHMSKIKCQAKKIESISKMPTAILVSMGLLMAISAFFVVYFLRSPAQLPFPWEWFPRISAINVVFISLPLFWGAWKWLKLKIWILGIMALYALTIENFAILTGFPYGSFEYGPIIGGKIGEVPWTVGFSWLPILLFAWILVCYIPKFWQRIVWGALLMTLFDVVLDPGATVLGFWIWENNQGFYGVPWMNFFGWIVSSLLGMWIWEEILKGAHILQKPNPEQARWLTLSGLISLIFWISINSLMGFSIPIVIGLLYFPIATRIIWKRKSQSLES